ncbi:MAG: radical SAM protein [Kofleriaceae bacterium]|nr:radical SAM protein [Kofleriaceae bacterium]MCB9571155.1 radical SAM protein [Kofleriaceae bacterium]
MSSLGYQTIYRRLNDAPGVAADRAVLPDDVAAWKAARQPLLTLEREAAVGDYPMLAFSVAYELELAGLIDCLELAGVPPLAADRDHRHPLVIAGGPLTFSNPVPLAPYCDLIVLGEADEVVLELVTLARDAGWRRDALLDALADRPGYYLPDRHGDDVPRIAAAGDACLPARSQIITPHAELSDMFLIEPARGCSRGCTYCVMRRSTNGGMRIVSPARVLAEIPDDATRVGLVGAAVTDHPQIREIVRGVVDAGRGVGISSLRADKLDDELVGLLAKGGYRTLTVAGDGASERMRRVIERSTKERHLLESAALASRHKLKTLKVYMMVGHPEETDDDIDELIRFTGELVAIHPRVAYGVAPLVAKRHTPLDGAPFAGVELVEARLARLRAGLKQYGGKAELRATSARWAWVEYMLSQGDRRAGLAVLDAHRAGGNFAAYKKAFRAHGAEPTGPRARVPSSLELIALKRRALATAVAGS